MKKNQRVETIFAHAVALQQSGRLRNTIYCSDRDIFILNQDKTVLLKFKMTREKDPIFEHPVSFDASDYDSQELEEKDGRIVFVKRESGLVRSKSCRTPDFNTDDIARMFKSFGKPQGKPISLSAGVCKLLDDSLSHIEFGAENGRLKIVQRNIYTGTIIVIETEKSTGIFSDAQVDDFGPIGLRTNDFFALYSFVDSISFWFGDNVAHFKSDDGVSKMSGIIGHCVYDEIGQDLDD